MQVENHQIKKINSLLELQADYENFRGASVGDKFQIVNINGRDVVEVSSGNNTTMVGWLQQLAARKYNNYSETAKADLASLKIFVHHLNQKASETLDYFEETPVHPIPWENYAYILSALFKAMCTAAESLDNVKESYSVIEDKRSLENMVRDIRSLGEDRVLMASFQHPDCDQITLKPNQIIVLMNAVNNNITKFREGLRAWFKLKGMKSEQDKYCCELWLNSKGFLCDPKKEDQTGNLKISHDGEDSFSSHIKKTSISSVQSKKMYVIRLQFFPWENMESYMHPFYTIIPYERMRENYPQNILYIYKMMIHMLNFMVKGAHLKSHQVEMKEKGGLPSWFRIMISPHKYSNMDLLKEKALSK